MLWPTKVHNLLEIQSKPRKDLSRLILDTKDVITRKQRNQFQQNEQQTFPYRLSKHIRTYKHNQRTSSSKNEFLSQNTWSNIQPLTLTKSCAQASEYNVEKMSEKLA